MIKGEKKLYTAVSNAKYGHQITSIMMNDHKQTQLLEKMDNS